MGDNPDKEISVVLAELFYRFYDEEMRSAGKESREALNLALRTPGRNGPIER